METQATIMAGCVIPDRQGRLLVLHRKEHDRWEIPGGKVEVADGEKPVNAAIREGGEELGEVVSVERYLGRAAFDFGDRKFIYHFFEGVMTTGNIPMAAEDIFDNLEYKFPAELRELHLAGKLSAFALHVLENKWVGETGESAA